MALLLIGYDLNEAKNYDDLYEAIKGLGTWWHHLDSTWLVKTSVSASDALDQLEKLMDSDDELLVVDVTRSPAAWRGFNERGSGWLSKAW